jgi:hypothetical protein
LAKNGKAVYRKFTSRTRRLCKNEQGEDMLEKLNSQPFSAIFPVFLRKNRRKSCERLLISLV